MEQESALRELRERALSPGRAQRPFDPDPVLTGRDHENVRTELFRALEAVRFQNSEGDRSGGVHPAPLGPRPGSGSPPPSPRNRTPTPLHPLGVLLLDALDLCDPRHLAGSCEPCPQSWLPFEGSCYFFSGPKTTWAAALSHCAHASAHLVFVGDPDEQVRRGRGRVQVERRMSPPF
ncbi:hypothetical protein P7K49_033143 [Saguinus oedipus]|uniref:Uncharacterized protein n=1 Tax=Saguinus oedipus TaxID=9490 RepID=A0ABQ9TR29_SAGOE|nr:hypothetical protein P7K49_033143 [Saguinus oedipus]